MPLITLNLGKAQPTDAVVKVELPDVLGPRLRALLRGAAEAFLVGAGLAVLGAWSDPAGIVFKKAAFVALGQAAARNGIIYLVGWVRMNAALKSRG